MTTRETEVEEALAAKGLPAGAPLKVLLQQHRADAGLAVAFGVVGMEETVESIFAVLDKEDVQIPEIAALRERFVRNQSHIERTLQATRN